MNTRCELWAKQKGLESPYPLLVHLLDTACVASALYDKWLRQGLREQFEDELGPAARKIVAYIAGIHDIGKANPSFQLQPSKSGAEWDAIRETIKDSGQYAKPSVRSKFRSDNPYIRRHEQISSYILAGGQRLNSSGKIADLGYVVPAWGHHGVFADASKKHSDGLKLEFDEAGWSQAHQDLLGAVAEGCGLSQEELNKKISPKLVLLLSGLTILADRIASGDKWVEQGKELVSEVKIKLEDPAGWVRFRYDDAVNRIANTVGIYQDWASPEEAKRSILGDYEPRPAQQAAMESGSGLWSLMATTGSGKTEAALLRHANCAERLIFLLPTQATTNAIMRRVQRAYESTSNVASLAHGLASIEDFYKIPVSVFDDEYSGEKNSEKENHPGGLFPSSFVKSGASRLLAPVCVGTVDQALLAALPGKWIHLRLLALANAHVVIDEVHTLDQYQSKLLCALMPWLSATNTRVTLLTATMASWQRNELLGAYAEAKSTGPFENNFPPIKFPSAEKVDEHHAFTRTELPASSRKLNLELNESSPENIENDHVAWALKMRGEFSRSRIGIIANVISRVQNVARQLAEAGENPIVLHSRMTAEHRRIASAKLLEALGPGSDSENITVVGSQAVEASLDIDLDLLRSELCPAPSLVQRAGRLWRRKDDARSLRVPDIDRQCLNIAWMPDEDGKISLPYLAAELRKTREWISQNETLVIPDNCQDFIDAAVIDFDTAVSGSDMDALSDYVRKRSAAEYAVAPIDSAIWEDARIRDLMNLTSKDSANEASTRLIDQGTQFRLILGGDEAIVPGAWQGSADDLVKIHSSDGEAIRRAMRGSMPLRIGKNALEKLGAISLADASSVLAGYYFLPEAHNVYDPLVGFDRDKAKR